MKLEKLTKRFDDNIAVNNISLNINPGEVFGLNGQNGAGKTTTFRMILDLIEPTSGEIIWNDDTKMNELNRARIGYLPEERGRYPKLTVENQILFLGKLRGKNKKELKNEIDYWLKKFQLEDKRKSMTDTLSKGNQQKVQIISSIIHNPEFLILDEPFSGFDPVNAMLLKEVIASLKKAGTTILFSSHRMDHVEELCDQICILKKGNALFNGPLAELKESYGKVNLFLKGNFDFNELKSLKGVKQAFYQKDEYKLVLENEKAANTIFDKVTSKGFIEKFSLEYLTLEEIFVKKVGEKNVQL